MAAKTSLELLGEGGAGGTQGNQDPTAKAAAVGAVAKVWKGARAHSGAVWAHSVVAQEGVAAAAAAVRGCGSPGWAATGTGDCSTLERPSKRRPLRA